MLIAEALFDCLDRETIKTLGTVGTGGCIPSNSESGFNGEQNEKMYVVLPQWALQKAGTPRASQR